LRGIVPDALYTGGLVVGSIGVVWLSAALIRRSREPYPITVP
jgi:hypothetical protein